MANPHRVEPQREVATNQAIWGDAGEDLTENDICYVSSFAAGVRTLKRAGADTVSEASGELWIADFTMPSGIRGKFVPWKAISANTAGLSNPVGTKMYLTNVTPGGYANAVETGAVYSRVVGQVAVNDADGTVVLNMNMPSEGALGTYGGTSGVFVVPMDITAGSALGVTLVDDGTVYNVIDAWLNVTTGDVGTETWTLKAGSDVIVTQSVISPDTDDVVRADNVDKAEGAGIGSFTANLSGANIAATCYVMVVKVS